MNFIDELKAHIAQCECNERLIQQYERHIDLLESWLFSQLCKNDGKLTRTQENIDAFNNAPKGFSFRALELELK